MENNRSSFWDFSDKLRHQENNYCNLSVNDSIWSNSGVSKMPEARRNLDSKLGGEMASSNPFYSNLRSDFNGGFSNDGWKDASNSGVKPVFNGLSNDARKDVGITGFSNDGLNDFRNFGFNSDSNLFTNDVWKDRTNSGFRSFGSSIGVANVGGMSLNGGFNKGIYSNPPPAMNFGYEKGINNVVGDENEIYEHGVGVGGNYGKKNKGDKEICKEENNSESQNAVDKRFKTLPPSESLPRNEIVGGYIFVCNNDTMQENLKRQLFGLPPRYRDSVRAITPGLPVFLYNYSTRQLHGIFEATSFGGTKIDPTAWEDKKKPGESRFPAQVSVKTRKACEPLEEDSFRPILHHYDGPKFRLELNVPEALSLLDIFYENENNP